MVRGENQSCNVPYYGQLTDIVELQYMKGIELCCLNVIGIVYLVKELVIREIGMEPLLLIHCES